MVHTALYVHRNLSSSTGRYSEDLGISVWKIRPRVSQYVL